MEVTAATRLVLSCARWFAGVDSAQLVRERAPQIQDWSAVLATADAHGMTPTTTRCLKTTCLDLMPTSIVAEMQSTQRRYAAQHLMLSRELLNLLQILGAEGIPVIPLKGPVLASQLWRNIASCIMSDLDLLVSRADITRVKKVLLAAGYRLDSRMPPGQENAAYHWKSALALVRDHPGVNLDLHWQMLPSLFPCAAYFDSV